MGFEDVRFEHLTTTPTTYKQEEEEEENPFMMMMMEDDEELILGNLGKKQEEEEEEKNNPFMMMMKMMMTNLEEQKKNTFIETNLNNLQEEKTKSSWKIIEKDENYFKKEEEPEINIQMKTRRESYISKMDEALYVPLNYDMKVNIKNPKTFQQEDYLILTLKCYSEQQNEEIMEQKAAMVTLDSAAHFQPKFKSKHSYAKTRQRYYFQMDISSRKAPLKSILVLKSTPFKIFCRRPASKTRSKNKRRNLEKFEKAFHHLVDYAQHQLVDQKEQQHAMHLLQNSLHQQLFVH